MKRKTQITELVPSDSRKSFNRKAWVILAADGRRYLRSYDTVMASADEDGNVARHSDFRSATTNRHVRSFLAQFGNGLTSKEFQELPVEGYSLTVKM